MTDPRILIIGDQFPTTHQLKDSLEGLGYRVCSMISNGEVAPEVLDQEKPDLILAEVSLKGKIDGIDSLSSAPVIYLAGQSDTQTIENMPVDAPYGCITEPFGVEDIQGTIELALQKIVLEKELKRTEEQYRTIVENSPTGILILDDSYRFTYINDQVTMIFGYPQEEIVGHDFREFLDNESKEVVVRSYLARQRGQQTPPKYEAYILRKDRQRRCIEINAIAVKGADSRVRTFAQILDITETKKVEEELRKHREQLEDLVDERTAELTEINRQLRREIEARAGVESALQQRTEQLESEINDRKRAEARAERLLGRQLILNKLSMALGQSRTLEAIYEQVYTHVQDSMDLRAFIISAYDPQTRLIQAEFLADGGTLSHVSQLPAIPLVQEQPGPQGQVILTGEPLYIPDRRALKNHSGVLYTIQDDGTLLEGPPPEDDREEYTQSILYAPLKVVGEVIGVMQIQSTRLDAYSPEDQNLFTSMANVVAVAVHNARLFAQLQSELDLRRQTEAELHQHKAHLEESVQERTKELRSANENLLKEIEEHHRTTRALAESETKFRNIIEQSRDGISLTDEQGMVIEWNQGMAQITGLAAEDVLGKPIWDIQFRLASPEDSNPTTYQQIKEQTLSLLANGHGPQSGSLFDHPYTHPDGNRRHLQGIVFPVKTENGYMIGSVIRDITGNKLSQLALQESEQRLRTLLENIQLIAIMLDSQGQLSFCNDYLLQLTGWERDQILGKRATELFVSTKRREKNGFQHIIETGENRPHDESLIRTRLGEERLIYWSNTILRDPQGNLLGITSIGEDITERRRAEAALRESESRYRQVVELSPMLIAIQKPHKISYINQTGASMLGAKDAQELVGKSLLEFIPRQERQELYERFFRLAQAGKPLPFIEQTIIRPDGSQVELEISATVTQQNGDTNVQVMAWDITERKLIQEALHRQAALAEIELAINQPHELQTALDRVAKITTRLLPASGGASVALWDENSHDFWISSSTVPDPMKTLIDRQIRKPDGACHWILKNMRPVITPDVSKDEFGPNPTLTKYNYMSYVGVPMIVEDAALGVLFVFDKHIRHYSQGDLDFLTALANRAALAIAKVRLYASLQQARTSAEETARAKDQFLANMSHELRTPLTAVVSVSELLQQTKLDPRQKEHVHTILSSSEKLISLINNILDFSKLEANKLSLEARPFDLHSCIEEALDLVTPEARHKEIELAYYVVEGVQNNLLGDAQRLGQVLTNLLNNAVKFTDRGEVTLSVRLRPPTAALLDPNTAGKKYSELLFAVKDSGIGIPTDKLDSLFTPFKQLDASTTRKYGGTGLGLAISKQIVNQMGGEIWVESSGVIGEGATFYFTIPYQTATGPLEPYKKKHSPQLMGKQVLVVSPSENQRQVLADQLNYWGMHVNAFNTCQQTLSWLQANTPIDLVMIGARSPQEDHDALLKEIYDHREPSAAPLVILVSGDELPAISAPTPIAGWFKTPIKPAKLFNLLMDIFSQPVEQHEIPEAKLSIGNEYPLKTLIAEDDPTSQKVIAMMLAYLGYQPVTASNGLEVIAALEQEPFDAIIMDLQMPEMDGISTTRYIRANMPADQQPYIIALTADARQQARDAMFAMGVDDYLTKPVLAEWLAQSLKQASEHLKRKDRQLQASVSQSATAPSSERAMDESVLADLIDLMGADASSALAELFDSFSETAPALVDNLKSAASTQDWAQVKWHAHTLKGNCELLGGTRLAHLCKQVETHAGQGNAGLIAEGVEQIEVEFIEFSALLAAKRAQL